MSLRRTPLTCVLLLTAWAIEQSHNHVSGKDVEEGSAHGIEYALASMINHRCEMEVMPQHRPLFLFAAELMTVYPQDAYLAKTDIEQLKGHALFSVFDGHDGDTTASLAYVRLQANVCTFQSIHRVTAILCVNSCFMQVPAMLRTPEFKPQELV